MTHAVSYLTCCFEYRDRPLLTQSGRKQNIYIALYWLQNHISVQMFMVFLCYLWMPWSDTRRGKEGRSFSFTAAINSTRAKFLVSLPNLQYLAMFRKNDHILLLCACHVFTPFSHSVMICMIITSWAIPRHRLGLSQFKNSSLPVKSLSYLRN